MLRRMVYEHPVYTHASLVAAQRALPALRATAAPTSAAPTTAGGSTRTAASPACEPALRLGCALVRSCLYEGRVVHDRRTPRSQRLSLRRLHVARRPRRAGGARHGRLWAFGADGRALTTIRSRDHLGDPDRVDPRERRRLSPAARHRPRGRRACSSLANARVLGYVFNPLSVFYCHDRDGELRCVVAEVHNTLRRAALLSAAIRASGPGRDRQGVLRLAVPHGRRPVPDGVRAARRPARGSR